MEGTSTKDKLIKSNDLFFNIFDNSSVGMILIDIETTKFQFVNKTFLKLFGYKKEEVIGKTSLELGIVEPEFRKKILSQLTKQDVVNNVEIIVRKKNREAFWSLASFQIILVMDKKCSLTSFIDISEQKKIEEYNGQLASIVESSNDAIISKSLEGTIMSWNKGAEKMLGYTAQKAIGENISLIIPQEYLHEEKEILEKICNNETIEHYETVRKKMSGEQFYVSLTVSPLKDVVGNIIGVSKIIRDITERKKAEDSTKLKDAFLSIISHEIRTPLNAILGYSNILIRRKSEEQVTEYLKIIKTAGEDLLTIINDIIDMSKIEAGTMVMESNSFSIKEIFQLLNESMIGKVKEKNIELSFSCDKDVPDELFGDQKRLSQILINLISNAIKFTEKGTINVRASVLEKENGNTLLEFSVTDTGLGISLDKLKTIFDRFRQVESHDKRKQGGVGLGLSIAKRLVELQGGTLTVASELKKGSVFTFCIPFKELS